MTKRYRLKVKQGSYWRLGLREYPSIEEAQARQEQLSHLGIKSVICTAAGTEVSL